MLRVQHRTGRNYPHSCPLWGDNRHDYQAPQLKDQLQTTPANKRRIHVPFRQYLPRQTIFWTVKQVSIDLKGFESVSTAVSKKSKKKGKIIGRERGKTDEIFRQEEMTREMEIKTLICCTSIYTAKMKRTGHNGETGILIHGRCEWKITPPLWKSVWKFLKELIMYLR